MPALIAEPSRLFQYGHSVGDAVPVAVAQTRNDACGKYDVAARFGGEEFVILIPRTGAHEAASKAELLRRRLEVPNPNGIAVSASFRVTQLPSGGGWQFEQLFSAADAAVYEAKAAGRNRVVRANG